MSDLEAKSKRRGTSAMLGRPITVLQLRKAEAGQLLSPWGRGVVVGGDGKMVPAWPLFTEQFSAGVNNRVRGPHGRAMSSARPRKQERDEQDPDAADRMLCVSHVLEETVAAQTHEHDVGRLHC